MKNYGRLLDVIDRCYAGPSCDEHEFDMKYIAEGVARVVKKHTIKLDKTRIVQNDKDMRDRLWEAALELLESCGVYNTSTGRRITFTRREIEQFLKDAPSEVILGEGPDARREAPRGLGDPRPPLVIGSPVGAIVSEEMFVPIMQSYIQEPIHDSVLSASLVTTLGRPARTKSPLEVIAAWHEAEMMFTAARRAGRPGISFGCVEMAISDVGHLSAISRGGFRPTDWAIVAMFSELKTNNELLIKVAHSIRTNGLMNGYYHPILGGLGGGEEGTAVLIVAGLVALQLIYMPAGQGSAAVGAMKSANTLPQTLRIASAAFSAIAEHANLIIGSATSPVSGPCTASLLDECVAAATVYTACGVGRYGGVRTAAGVVLDHCTGLESRFNGEVMHAAAGLSLDEANEIATKAVAAYAPVLQGDSPVGKSFQEAYDVATLRPTPEWQTIYDEAKGRASGWGLKFK